MIRKCSGCGVPLQSDDPDKVGYVPPEKLSIAKLCQRCFRIKHYGEFRSVSIEGFPFDEIAGGVDLICFIVDGVDIEGSWVLDSLGHLRKIWLVINKADLLPFSKEEVLGWIRKEKGWDRKAFLISVRKGWGLRSFWEELTFAYKGRRIAFMGATNVGKSSLMARLLGDSDITVSPWPGTTISLVERALPDGTIFIDTPGIIPYGRIYDLLCPDCQKMIIPSKKLCGKLFFLKEGKSLTLGGLSALTIKKGRLLLKPMISHEVPLHRTSEQRLGEVLIKASGDWLRPPCKGCFATLEELGWKEEEVDVKEGEDLFISGMGWVSLLEGEGKVKVLLPQGVRYNILGGIRR